MKPSDDLFVLIRALTASEKGYFRKQVVTESAKENNYLRLFDAIEKQKEYDENTIKKKFSGEVFIKQLTNTKLYLYQLILKHLREYHRQRSVKMQARLLLDETEILMHKGLYKQAEKKIQAHRKFAMQYQNWTSLTEGSEQAESVINRTGVSKDRGTDFNTIYAQRSNYLQILLENAQMRKLERELLMLNQKLGPTRNANVLKQIDKFSKNPLLKQDVSASSLDTQFRFNQINALLALHRSDYKKEADYFSRNVKLIETHPALREAFYKEYYSVALHNFINASMIADMFDPAWEAIEKLKNEPAKSLAQQARLFYYLLRDETYFWIRKGNAKNGLALKQQFEKGVAELGNAIIPDHIITIHFNFAVLHLEMKEFELSIKYLEKALEARHYAALENIQSFARILQIMNHYELGNFQLLPHLVSTTEFFLKKKEILFAYEKAILQFFKKIANYPDKRETKKEAIALKQKLKSLYQNPLERNAALVFDFSGWLEKLIARLG